MSAIAGIIQFDGRAVDRSTLERMQTLLTPYGKDTQRHIYQGTAAFLRTLLRTTPEESFDRQPLVHAESGTTLVFDGRIDNREELAHGLGLKSAETALMADSDLVLRACLRWDTGAVERLLGDFALACWSARERRLWLARDPMGIRPLFWHQQDGFFAFSTMPKALFAIPGVPRALCEERLHDYLCLLPMVGPESFFKGVFRIEPGQFLVLDGARVACHRYHEFDPEREIKLGSDDEYVEALREQLDRSVACRLRGVGPIASHLSSGFDSSTVTAVAAQQLADRNQGLLAYTAVPREGFDGRVGRGFHVDEGPGARAVAARFPNIDHIELRTGNRSPVERLQESVERLDRAPLNLCNAVWANSIQEDAAKRGAKVLLSGTLGNMTISHDGATYLPWLFGRGRWVTLWIELRALRRRYPKWRWRVLLEHCMAPYFPRALWEALERRRGREKNLFNYTAISRDFSERMNSNERARRVGWDLRYRPWRDGRRQRIAVLGRMDNGEYYAAANAIGVELRAPTLDLRLTEFTLAVPERQFLHDGRIRWLLARVMADMLPSEILDSRTRGLQAADWYEGAGASLAQLRSELARLAENDSARRYLDMSALNTILENWPQAGWDSHQIDQAYRYKLLRGLAVGGFICYAEERN